MYRLQKIRNLNELIGQPINMVCVGPYDARVKFEKGTIIQALHKSEASIGESTHTWRFGGEWIDSTHVHKGVGQNVTEIIRESYVELKIVLSNIVALSFITEESPYESNNITTADGILDVI